MFLTVFLSSPQVLIVPSKCCFPEHGIIHNSHLLESRSQIIFIIQYRDTFQFFENCVPFIDQYEWIHCFHGTIADSSTPIRHLGVQKRCSHVSFIFLLPIFPTNWQILIYKVDNCCFYLVVMICAMHFLQCEGWYKRQIVMRNEDI